MANSKEEPEKPQKQQETSENKEPQNAGSEQDAPSSSTIEAKDAKKTDVAPPSDGMMRIKVYSPYQTYFDDEASSISAVNGTGPFDILVGHHKFLTLLLPCEMNIVTANGEEKIKISRGIMYVKEDRVTVFLDV